MKKLHQIFLQKFIILFGILFIVIGGITYYWMKNFYINQTKLALLHNIKLISYNLDNINNINKIKNIAKHIKKDLNLRLTIIDDNGKILIESHKGKKLLDNHKNRIEIIKALKNPYGFAIRHSYAINKDLLYIAKKYSYKGGLLYIRMAREIRTINDKIVYLALKLLIVLLIFFSISFYITYKLSSSIEDEISNISKFLINLTKKRKNTYINSNFSKELNQITKLLTKVSKILTKQDKQKEKYTKNLQNSNIQKDDIISAISHEFKNPIAVINGYAQTLIEDKNINNDIKDRFLNKIYKSGNRLNNLINTLRLSIKLDKGKQTLQMSKVNMKSFLEENIELISLNYKNREILLEVKVNYQLNIDKTLFSIAVINLIENGLKYSDDTVTIVLSKNKISIIDTGIGINEDDKSLITQKFYRISSNGWNNSLGLGLSIVLNILNQHNFKLNIQSEKNEGSNFTIIC
jgi:signal transduction histidine kinase